MENKNEITGLSISLYDNCTVVCFGAFSTPTGVIYEGVSKSFRTDVKVKVELSLCFN
jgi:hypothetical protein